MRRRSLTLALLLLILLSIISPTFAQDGIAEWTYMQYFAMDNNLEAALYGDLTEMQAVGSSDEFNIVAQVDRIDGYETRFGDWTDTRRFLLAHEPQPVLTPEQKIEEILMLVYMQPDSDPEALRAELRQLSTDDPVTYLSLLTDAGVNPEDTALIDRIVFNNSLGMEFNTEPLADLGEVDMGTPEALVDFVTWAVANYPAQHYALTISTHGGGWLGNGPDESDDHDQLQLPEIVQALEQIRTTTGIDQLDIIGFDACLMGQLEVYQALAPYTQYVIAAEETIPGNGWEYTTPFSELADDPTMSARQFGINIIDSYLAYYAGPGARTKVDLHLIETRQIPAVVEALDTFANLASQDTLDKLSALGVARNNAQLFGSDAGDVLGTGSSS
ncbi:MAG: clostripain-related cysteine peptidase, partial [Chloroflexota bacterium]